MSATSTEGAKTFTDKQRMDWLDEQGRKHGHGLCHEGYGDYSYYVDQWYRGTTYQTAREVIDGILREECK